MGKVYRAFSESTRILFLTISLTLEGLGVVHLLFYILISSFGFAISSPHFLHLVNSNGSYIRIKTLILGSALCCSTKTLKVHESLL
jgi:hypothetical protein